MTTPDTKAIRENMEALGGGTTGQRYVNEPKKMELIGRIHRVLNPENCSAEFVLAWDRPEAGEVDETDEANASLIVTATDMRETILALCDALDAAQAEKDHADRLADALHHMVNSTIHPDQMADEALAAHQARRAE